VLTDRRNLTVCTDFSNSYKERLIRKADLKNISWSGGVMSAFLDVPKVNSVSSCRPVATVQFLCIEFTGFHDNLTSRLSYFSTNLPRREESILRLIL
jgi:hypothetical protein